MARIRYISDHLYEQQLVKPKSAIPQDLENFEYGESVYTSTTSFEHPKFNKTLWYVDHLRYRPEFFPRFAIDGFNRPPKYMAPVLFANFENNLKINYETHVNRFITVFVDKADVENVLAEMHKLGGYRVRSFRNMFLVNDRDNVSSLRLIPENISDLLDDEFLNLCQHHHIRNNERDEIFYVDAVRQMNTRRRERNLLFINKTDS
ncbi:hypothetical protein P9112_014062 [Eukaryota sp. TZLM1-RC]